MVTISWHRQWVLYTQFPSHQFFQQFHLFGGIFLFIIKIINLGRIGFQVIQFTTTIIVEY